MKKYLIGFLSALLVLASIFGASSKGPRPRRATDETSGPDRILWV
jgi:hypothetical protein